MRGKTVPSDLYWKLRAIQAETGLLHEKLAGIGAMNHAVGMVGRFARDIEGMTGGLLGTLQGIAGAAGREAALVVQEIGSQLGLTSDPTTWTVDLGSGPETATIVEGPDPSEDDE